MRSILHFKTISELTSQFRLGKINHPLVAVVDFTTVVDDLPANTRICADFYAVMFKNYCSNHIKYGRKSIDFQDGSLICIAPKQVIDLENEYEDNVDKMGWGLFFHPDLIRGTSLQNNIKQYSFFSYDVAESLHLSDKEKLILFDCIKKIAHEVNDNLDRYSQALIVSTIELLLNYCLRFYGRQFITRTSVHSDLVSQVENYLTDYFNDTSVSERGLPTVRSLANKLHISPSYLSDLLKKETGMSAQQHIHHYIIEEAKTVLLNSNASVSEVAYSLGFAYPQYFSRIFKEKTGKSPIAFRENN